MCGWGGATASNSVGFGDDEEAGWGVAVGEGNSKGPQEFEPQMIFVDSEEFLVNVIPLGPPQPPGVRGNREDVGRLGGELTLSRGPEKWVEYLQPLEP